MCTIRATVIKNSCATLASTFQDVFRVYIMEKSVRGVK